MGTNDEVGRTYDYPSIEDVEVSSDIERVEFEPILLKRQRVVKGTVRVAAGQPLSSVTVVIHSGSFRHLNGRAVTGDDGRFEMRVRRWEAMTGRLANGQPLRHQAHWAIRERPAAGASPPVFTPLAVIDDDPDALVLELP
jgi:hypothetical protein